MIWWITGIKLADFLVSYIYKVPRTQDVLGRLCNPCSIQPSLRPSLPSHTSTPVFPVLYLSDAFNYFAFFLIFSRRCHKLIWIYLYFWIQESSAFSFSKHFQSCCDIQKVTEPLLTHLPTSLPKHDSVDLCKLCSTKKQCVVWAHFMLIKRRCKFDKSSANKTRYFLPDQCQW